MDTNRVCREISRLLSHASNEDEMTVLLNGLLTPQEAEEIIFRWRLMVLLLDGMPQREISHELGVSLGKIARGSRLLKYGPQEFRDLVERIVGKSDNR